VKAAVSKPADRRTAARVRRGTSADRVPWTPWTSAGSDVNMVMCEASVVAASAMTFSKTVPFAARCRSRNGEVSRW
jgi:hypothetical protein